MSRLEGTIRDVESVETKALALLGLVVAIVGVALGTHPPWSDSSWLPLPMTAVAGGAFLSALIPRKRWQGPNVLAAHAVLAAGEERPVDSARAVLRVLIDDDLRNRRIRKAKVELCIIGLVAMTFAAIVSIAVVLGGGR